MNKVRYGIIGVGNMGRAHAFSLLNEVKGAELTAVCDISPERLEWAAEQLPEQVLRFSTAEELFTSGSIDAVLISTPHYDHPPLAIEALKHGLHVLIEKPAGVFTKAVQDMNDAAAQSDRKFGIMYNQRTNPLYKKLKELIASGELGEIRRTNWIITDWYRSQSYYNSGGWRATWAGEGGGVLLNQDPHQLDLWQWTTGMMPKRVRAFCHFGKYRNIEVEDDVTAYVEYENGATGLFITTTGEAPGTNRFEITGDNGKIVVEDGSLTFWRLRTPEPEFNATYTGGFGQPECWKCEIPVDKSNGGSHQGILRNFTNAILNDEPLIAPGEEGIRGLTLSNAMYLSAWTDNWVELPIDADLFHEHLMEKVQSSTFKKEASQGKALDVTGTH
ncbi:MULTISPECIES: Gfo/Idh/MocA family oxidoreductase [unclassified Paenibacillus]|uniref:Gfo/Idh/MocA family protein n=1 Tax=unclassified Paenibacillus TaxID=185978 RepID=UPI0024068DE4|nr:MULTISPECIES: Gfo/Idh/MocA family oxidoreductase [unclassified Paenibacillus]MDF9839188.1 putative dehydrogenase [Paenibacillus sp. PastF-2]MDF9845770.1 putative dehydrogenase [Paenibacillus sp. PastM-2]MDF9852342.1 putative dehydrogenase [Paenibacillus sp. PastF-1]MDH6477928.1 putative dehydrogenase [Paenibacillus sp. PastH-2]MDH6505666.1 putative dehydrogenase [Paenibacillus sp. PastM-3]